MQSLKNDQRWGAKTKTVGLHEKGTVQYQTYQNSAVPLVPKFEPYPDDRV
jgi:hypothetical protein